MRDEVTRQCPQTTTSEEKGEPKQIQTEVHLLTSLTARPNRLTSRSLRTTCFIQVTEEAECRMKVPSRVQQRNSNKKEVVKELGWSTPSVVILVGLV